MKNKAEILSEKNAVLSFLQENNNPSLIKKVKEIIDNFRSVNNNEIPEWQKEEVQKRMENFENNPNSAIGFGNFLDKLEADASKTHNY